MTHIDDIETCHDCDGSGEVWIGEGAWAECDACDGLGNVELDRPSEEMTHVDGIEMRISALTVPEQCPDGECEMCQQVRDARAMLTFVREVEALTENRERAVAVDSRWSGRTAYMTLLIQLHEALDRLNGGV